MRKITLSKPLNRGKLYSPLKIINFLRLKKLMSETKLRDLLTRKYCHAGAAALFDKPANGVKKTPRCLPRQRGGHRAFTCTACQKPFSKNGDGTGNVGVDVQGLDVGSRADDVAVKMPFRIGVMTVPPLPLALPSVAVRVGLRSSLAPDST